MYNLFKSATPSSTNPAVSSLNSNITTQPTSDNSTNNNNNNNNNNNTNANNNNNNNNTDTPSIPSPQQAIETAYSSLNSFIEAETECTDISLDLLERINWNSINHYSAMADSAMRLETDKDQVKSLNENIIHSINQVDAIAQQIDELEALTKEIDEWSREIEVKSRRYKPSRKSDVSLY